MHSEDNSARTIIDTLIVSDIHLGSDVSRSEQLSALIDRYQFRRLLLNGDVFDDLNFHRLSKRDWKLLSQIRKISNPKHGIEVVWVIGNHDGGVADILSHIIGTPVYEMYQWTVNGTSILAIHGHQFDKWITDHAIVTEIATWLYWVLQKIDRQHRVARWVKRRSKKFLRLSAKVSADAARFGRKHGADVVTCGHIHLAMDVKVENVRYVNSGCWTDVPSHYVIVLDDGSILLRSEP